MNSLGPFTPQGFMPKEVPYLWLEQPATILGTICFTSFLLKKVSGTKLFKTYVPKIVDFENPDDPDDNEHHFLFRFFLKNFFRVKLEDFPFLAREYQKLILNNFGRFIISLKILSVLSTFGFSYFLSKFITSIIFELVEQSFENAWLENYNKDFPIVPVLSKDESVQKNPKFKKEENKVDFSLNPSNGREKMTDYNERNLNKVVGGDFLEDLSDLPGVKFALEKLESLKGNSSDEEEKFALRRFFEELLKVFPKEAIEQEIDKLLNKISNNTFNK
jgi:hypothetical protein